MTSIEAFRKGRSRWLMWTAICAILACCFLVKGGTLSDLLSALLIGAANGIAVGFALGPAAHKGAIILSGLFAGTPFYFIGISGFIIEADDAHQLRRGVPSDSIPVVSIFLIVGGAFSLAQALRVRGHSRRGALP
ncbi:MAG: hypothetical protein WB628_09035 [Candidatus Sulfotelmatobacter sp.]